MTTTKRTPWRFLIVCWLVIAVVTTAVPVVDYLRKPPDTVYTGYSYESVGDIFFYLNLIEQAKNGEVLFRNFMTPEPHVPTFFNPLFLVMGNAARWFHLSELVVWHASRVLLIFFFLLALYGFLKELLTHERLVRLSCIIVFATGGIYLRNYEASTFLSFLYSPLPILSLTLTLYALSLLFRAFAQGWSKRRIAVLFLLTIIQAVTHPYILILWVFVPCTFLFCEVLLRQRTILSALHFSLPVILPALLGYLYLFFTIQRNPILQLWAEGAKILPWEWHYVLFATVALLPLAVVGVVIHRSYFRSQRVGLFLILMFFLTLFFSRLSAYPYAGRLMVLLHLPLAILASVGVYWFWSKTKDRQGLRVVLAFLLALSLADNVRHLKENYFGTYFQASNRYLTSTDVRAFQWVRDNTPADSLLLHAPAWDTIAARQAYRPVYATQGGITSHYPQRYFDALEIYSGTVAPEILQRFVVYYGVRYILIGPRDRLSGHWEAERFDNPYYKEVFAFELQPERYPFLRLVYDEDGFQIYEVIDGTQ